VQFKRSVLEGIARGDVTLAFRRWKRPMISAGTRLRTALGEVLIGNVEPMEDTPLTEEDARRAGFASLADLERDLREGDDRVLYRIEIAGMDADARDALCQDDAIGSEEAAALAALLRRWDGTKGVDGYHRRVLEMIAGEPAVAASVFAERLGVEKLKFKRDVRKLKELGLTESLDVGYRLSPRGTRFLRLLEGSER
jgi:hypothetical protein